MAQDTGYKEEWQTQRLSGNVVDLLLEPKPLHVSGVISNLPKDRGKLRVRIDGQDNEATVDEKGQFDIPVFGVRVTQVYGRIFEGDRDICSWGPKSIAAPVLIQLPCGVTPSSEKKQGAHSN